METNPDNILELLSKRHSEWVYMAMYVGCPEHYAEDVVQEVYLKLYKHRKNIHVKLVGNDGDVNKSYMFISIKNMVADVMTRETKDVNYDEFYTQAYEQPNMEKEMAFNRLMNKIKVEVDSWENYHKILFKTYAMTDLTMRSLGEGTGRGLNHIFNNIAICKAELKEKFSEDFEDFKNGDYDKI